MPKEVLAENARVISVKSAQVLRNIDETRELLVSEVAGGGQCVIDCSRIDEADISFVQLLLAARLTARHLGGSLRLADPSPALAAVLERAGVPNAANDPFWSGAQS